MGSKNIKKEKEEFEKLLDEDEKLELLEKLNEQEKYLKDECDLRCRILNGATKRNPYGRALTVKELKQLSPSRAYTREYDRAIGGRW